MKLDRLLISIDPFPIKRAKGDFVWVSQQLLALAQQLLTHKNIEICFAGNEATADTIQKITEELKLDKDKFTIKISPKQIHANLYNKYNSDIIAWKHLIDETTYDEEWNYQAFYFEIKNCFNPNAVINWSYNVCIRRVFSDRPVISLELGMLRPPYPLSCYWDLQGLNGASSFSRLIKQWTPILTDKTRNYLAENVGKFKTRYADLIQKTQSWRARRFLKSVPHPFIVVFLQCEVDANALAFSNGHDVSTVLYLAKRIHNEQGATVIVKSHPGNKFYYKYFCDVEGLHYAKNVRSVDLLANSVGTISINSSTTAESVLAGKPTLQLGKSAMSSDDISILFSNIHDFLSSIRGEKRPDTNKNYDTDLVLALFLFAYQFPSDADYIYERVSLEVEFFNKPLPSEAFEDMLKKHIVKIMERD
jgi:hypothetical protein